MIFVAMLAIFGIDTIIAGIFAMWYARRLSLRKGVPKLWQRARVAAIVLGLALAALSFHPACYPGYPLTIEEGPGTVIGAPFMLAFFDGEGRDYVGPLTLPAVFGNAVFWFMLPQIAVTLWGWRRSRQAWLKPSE